MKQIVTIILILFSSSLGYSQTDQSTELLIHYAPDRSIVLSGHKYSKSDSNLLLKIDSNISVDSIIEHYKIKIEFIPDTTHFGSIETHIELDSNNFSQLIIKANLVMSLVQYGYGGARNFDDLTKKYAVVYHAGGCVFDPSEFELKFERYMRSLLDIRNGKDWQDRYHEEALEKN
jgi:hypothetical protein